MSNRLTLLITTAKQKISAVAHFIEHFFYVFELFVVLK